MSPGHGPIELATLTISNQRSIGKTRTISLCFEGLLKVRIWFSPLTCTHADADLVLVLALGESIGVFPEGTSHTEPHMIALKDGVSWTALEYILYLLGSSEDNASSSQKEQRRPGKKAVVVPVGVAYVDKTKYRSRTVVQSVKTMTEDQKNPADM